MPGMAGSFWGGGWRIYLYIEFLYLEERLANTIVIFILLPIEERFANAFCLSGDVEN